MVTTNPVSKRKRDLKKLIKLMGKQHERNIPPVKPLVNTLNSVLKDEELKLLLQMGTGEYTYKEILSLSNLSENKFDEILEGVNQKGFLHEKQTENSSDTYILNPIVVGWLEAQMPYLMGRPEEKEFAYWFDEFAKYARKLNFFPVRNLANFFARQTSIPNQSIGITKKIDIDHSLDVSDSEIYPTMTVTDLVIENAKTHPVVIFPCMCRRITSVLDKPCRFDIPIEHGCLGFGEFTKPYVKYGHARIIEKEEAIDILHQVRDKGAVHTIYHEKDDANRPEVGICNCCWDCCGFFKSYNYGGAPFMYKCYFRAEIQNTDECNGCRTCEKYCPTAAISVINKKINIDEKKCIGCGQCAHQCPQDVPVIITDPRNVFLPIIRKSEARLNGN